MVFHADITPRNPEATATGLAQLALDKAMRMQTRKTAGVTLHGPDGSTILAGSSAGDGGISKWVGDTTPPGKPTGIAASSGSCLIIVSWDGSLEGGVPADFDHVQILVDGSDAGSMRAAGMLTVGPYGIGSLHTVTAVAWDDAHAQDGSPAPNASPACAPIRVTVTGADIDPSRLGITVTKSDKDPQGRGEHTGDLWVRYGGGYGDNIVSDPSGKDFVGQWTYNGMGGTSASNSVATWIRTRPFGSDRWSDLVNKASTQVLHDGDRVRVSARIKVEAYTASQCEVFIGAKASKGGSDLSKVTTVTVSGWTTATVDLPITKAGKDGDTFSFILSVHSTAPSTDTIILATDFGLEPPSRSVLEGEWWWDGSKWVQIPIALYLDQLAVRDVQMDEAVVGMLAAGIIKSGTFETSDSGARVVIDEDGLRSYDDDGLPTFTLDATTGEVKGSGSWQTSTAGNRLTLSQERIKAGANTDISRGALQALHDNQLLWSIWGESGAGDNAGQSVRMCLSANAGLRPPKVTIQGEGASSGIYLDALRVIMQGIPADFADYDTASVMTFAGNVVPYKGLMRMYKRAGVFFLDFNVQGRDGALFPQGQLVPCVALSRDVMPSSAIDVWAYGGYGTLVRVHVFGPGEGQPQGTISVTAKDRSTDYVSGQLHWVQ